MHVLISELLLVKAGQSAGVSGDTVFNYHCKWPRTCVSEAFPSCALLLRNAGS